MKKQELIDYYEAKIRDLVYAHHEAIEREEEFQSARECQLELRLADRQREVERLTQFAMAFNLEPAVEKIIRVLGACLPPKPLVVLTPEQKYLARMRMDNATARELLIRDREEKESAGWCYLHRSYQEECGC